MRYIKPEKPVQSFGENTSFLLAPDSWLLNSIFFIRVYLCLSVVPLLFAFPNVVYGATIPAGEIGAAVERTVREHASLRGLDFEITVPHVKDVEITGDGTPLIQASLAGKEIRGIAAPVRVEFLDGNGEVLRSIHLVAQVRTYAIVAVAARGIDRGDTLRAEDVLLTRADVSTIRGYYTKSDEIAGNLASQSLKAGAIIQTSIVKPKPLVHRGDRVTMKAVVGGVEIVGSGVSRQDGGLGEYIRVFNTQTRASVVCRVLDAQNVVIRKTGG